MIRRFLFLAAALLGGFLLSAEAQQINTSGAASSGVTSANVQNQAASCAADTGAADVYVVTLSPAPSAYASLQRFCFKAVNANATTTPTLNVNGLGAKTITKNGGAALAANDIKSGQVVDVEYDGTNFQMQSTLGNAASGGSVSVNGATVASPNLQNTDTAFHQMNAAAWTASGSNISAQQYMYPQTCVHWGDSISTIGTTSGGTALPTGTGGYVGLLTINECSGVWIPAAASSDMSADLNLKVYAQAASTYLFPSAYANNRAAISTIMIGTNEANSKQTSGYQTGVYRPSQYGVLAFLSIPRANRLNATDATCTATGTWTADNQFFSGMGKKSNTNGDKIVCTGVVTTAASPFIYYGYGAVDSNAGASNIKIDTVACTDTVLGSSTLNYVGGTAISTTNGATKAVFVARCAAAAGTHTVEVDVTSATNASNVVYFEWVGSMPAIGSNLSFLPRILESGVLKQRSDANATWTTNYNTEISSIISTLAGDTLPIQFVTVNDLPTAVGDYTDALHPNDILHALIHDRFSQYMQGFGGNKFTALAIGGGDATNQWLNPVLCITNSGGQFAFGNACPVDKNSLGNMGATVDANVINAKTALQVYTDNAGVLGNLIGSWGGAQLGLSNNTQLYFSNSTTSVSTAQSGISGATAGVISIDSTASANGLGSLKAAKILSTANCAAVGTSASPSVASCSAASAGHFSCATNATGATCTVNTTAVTANSEIFVLESDNSATGTALGVTCNTSTTVNPATRLLASFVAGTSFTINLGTVTTNPACFSFFIVN